MKIVKQNAKNQYHTWQMKGQAEKGGAMRIKSNLQTHGHHSGFKQMAHIQRGGGVNNSHMK